jgi:hypothetical protein
MFGILQATGSDDQNVDDDKSLGGGMVEVHGDIALALRFTESGKSGR